jgi:hypothetical protein
VGILLDCNGLEAALVDGSSPPAPSRIAPSSGVNGSQALHERRQAGIIQWPDHQMPVVRHDAVGEQSNWESAKRFDENLEERLAVARMLEQGDALNGPVQNVEHDLAS